MNKLLAAIFAVILIGSAGLFFYYNDIAHKEEALSKASPGPTLNPQEPINMQGNTYLEPQGSFSIAYPNDYTLDTQDPIHIRIFKRGETQRPQSEMSDGIILVLEPIQLNGNSLESLVDSRISDAIADGTSEIVIPKKATTLNDYPGFSYSLRGLGVSDNIAVQINTTSQNAVLITYSVSDPTQKGYQQELNQILSSLVLIK